MLLLSTLIVEEITTTLFTSINDPPVVVDSRFNILLLKSPFVIKNPSFGASMSTISKLSIVIEHVSQFKMFDPTVGIFFTFMFETVIVNDIPLMTLLVTVEFTKFKVSNSTVLPFKYNHAPFVVVVLSTFNTPPRSVD